MTGYTEFSIIPHKEHFPAAGVDAQVWWKVLKVGRVCSKAREVMRYGRRLGLQPDANDIQGCDYVLLVRIQQRPRHL